MWEAMGVGGRKCECNFICVHVKEVGIACVQTIHRLGSQSFPSPVFDCQYVKNDGKILDFLIR